MSLRVRGKFVPNISLWVRGKVEKGSAAEPARKREKEKKEAPLSLPGKEKKRKRGCL